MTAPEHHAQGGSPPPVVELVCSSCDDVLRMHEIVMGRRTQGTWVAKVLEDHAGQFGFNNVFSVIQEELVNLADDHAACGVDDSADAVDAVSASDLEAVGLAVAASSMEAFVLNRSDSAAKPPVVADEMEQDWVPMAFGGGGQRGTDAAPVPARARPRSVASGRGKKKKTS